MTAHLLKNISSLELEFANLWEEYHPELDLVFQYPVKRYRIDFCHVQTKTGIECDGGTWKSGLGHSSGSGIQHGAEKSCNLAVEGYLIIRLTTSMITVDWLDKVAQIINYRLLHNL